MNKQPETRRTRCQVAADFGGYAGESEDCLPGMVDYLEGAGEGEDVVRVVVGGLPLSLEFVEGVGEFPDGSGEMLHVSGVLESASGFTATSAPAGSSRRELRRAGVPRDHIYRDVGASGSTGTQERRGWHRYLAVNPLPAAWLGELVPVHGPHRPAASLGEHIGLRAGTPLAAPLAAGVVGAELIRMRQIASGIDFTGASDEDVMRIWLLRHFLGGQSRPDGLQGRDSGFQTETLHQQHCPGLVAQTGGMEQGKKTVISVLREALH